MMGMLVEWGEALSSDIVALAIACIALVLAVAIFALRDRPQPRDPYTLADLLNPETLKGEALRANAATPDSRRTRREPTDGDRKAAIRKAEELEQLAAAIRAMHGDPEAHEEEADYLAGEGFVIVDHQPALTAPAVANEVVSIADFEDVKLLGSPNQTKAA
ncbi:MAG: hypothetical protein ABJP70_12250 [Erythrobacter sp.]